MIDYIVCAAALVAEERVRQLQMRVHSNRVSAATTSSQQDLKNKREVSCFTYNLSFFLAFSLKGSEELIRRVEEDFRGSSHITAEVHSSELHCIV